MTELVLIELGSLNHKGWVLILLDVNLDLTANTSSLGVFAHEIVEFLNSIFVRSRSNVEQKGELRLEILADTLEEPTMGVDLAVITLLDAEHKVDSATS